MARLRNEPELQQFYCLPFSKKIYTFQYQAGKLAHATTTYINLIEINLLLKYAKTCVDLNYHTAVYMGI